MRISTTEFLTGTLPELMAQQSNVNQLNREIATGETMPDATADPAGAGLAIETSSEIHRLAYDAGNAQAGAQSIQNALAALQQVSTLVNQLRQTALAGASGTASAGASQSLAAEAQNALQQLVQLANTKDANGNYIFAGSDASTMPFSVAANGQVAFSGDAATNAVEIAPGLSLPVTASGQGIFVNVPAGGNGVAVTADATNSGGAVALVQGVTSISQVAAARAAGTQYRIAFASAGFGSIGYTVVSGSGSPGSSGFAASSGTVASGTLDASSFTSGADLRFAGLDVQIEGTPAAGDSFVVQPGATASLFQTAQDLIGALTDQTGSVSRQRLQNVLGNLDAAQTSVLSAEAGFGAGLSEIQAVQGQDQTQSAHAQAQLSDLQSANLPQVMANYSASVTALQAAELAFGRIQNLTLFSVIHP